MYRRMPKLTTLPRTRWRRASPGATSASRAPGRRHDAAGDYMCVHAAGQTHVMRATLGELERRLDPKPFRRIHRSTIVNIAHVEEIRTHPNGEATVILRGGQRLKRSRSYLGSLMPPS